MGRIPFRLLVATTTRLSLPMGQGRAGVNLGIIIEATYGLHKISESGGVGYALNADFVVPAEKNASYFELLECYLTVAAWNDAVREAQLVSNWQYFGSEDEAREAVAPMLSLTVVSSIGYCPGNKIFYAQEFGSDAANCAEGSGFGKTARFFQEYSDSRSLTTFALETYLTEAAVAAPDEETAYPWRDAPATGYLAPTFAWPGDADPAITAAAAALGQELQTDLAATSGHEDELEGGLGVYVNYAHGEEPLENIYCADKLPRLAALRRDGIKTTSLPTTWPCRPGTRRCDWGSRCSVLQIPRGCEKGTLRLDSASVSL
ncbi:Uu.00g085760.m01.CDS01 [Anthostomella pinea]|uniref:Uu.00g085760.m01.CDS01 n=1 Tax=Anthostomella pinea TaxID=933095 RepID=A0AAI8VN64_9PEZI|nr:Uu.00g085760.m01.CDS01 [Anthostomella pinea]